MQDGRNGPAFVRQMPSDAMLRAPRELVRSSAYSSWPWSPEKAGLTPPERSRRRLALGAWRVLRP